MNKVLQLGSSVIPTTESSITTSRVSSSESVGSTLAREYFKSILPSLGTF